MSDKNIFSNISRSSEGGNSAGVVQIEDNDYLFDIYLWNGETKVGITFSSIEELKIVDDLRYFYSYGYMLFSNNYDALESFNAEGKTKGYNFRGDGRDYLQVEIMPQLRPNDEMVEENSEAEKKEHCIKYTFSIYKIEEETREDKGIKFKKIYFWDVDYQLLNEIDAHCTTSEVTLTETGSTPLRQKTELNPTFNSNGKNSIQNTDDFKRYTGDIIKYLLDKCLNKISKSGFKASNEFWDKGGGLLEHHTHSKHKAIDDLQYLLQYHVSEKQSNYVPCILKKTRYVEDYTLVPITTYLQTKVSENFILGKLNNSGGDGMGSVMNFGSNQSESAINHIGYNIIENYSFIKPDTDMVQKDISTHFVHSYDPSGFFTCSIKSNNLKNSTKSIFENNVKHSGDTQGYDILPTNQLREENNNVQHVYSSGLGVGQNFQKLNFGRNKGLMASVFKNTAIYFRIRGLTRRKSGTFFTLTRNNEDSLSDHDKMVLGKYFTTLVIHEFGRGTYFNHIYATKPSSEEKQDFAKML